mgnify:CR=1 FL=1
MFESKREEINGYFYKFNSAWYSIFQPPASLRSAGIFYNIRVVLRVGARGFYRAIFCMRSLDFLAISCSYFITFFASHK